MGIVLTAEKLLQLQEGNDEGEGLGLPIINNGYYQITNKATGKIRFFRLTTNNADAKHFPGQRVLGVKVNDNRFIPFAIVDGETITVLENNRGLNGTKSHYEDYAEKFLDLVLNGDDSDFADTYEMTVSSKCVECNATLHDMDDISKGICGLCFSAIANMELCCATSE